MTAEIKHFTGSTQADLPPEKVLRAALTDELIEHVVVIIKRRGDREPSVATSSGEYFVQAGCEKYLRRLRREDANDWAKQLFGLLRDPLNASIVDRDEAVMRLKRET